MSGQIVHLEADPHAAVQKLLPWYLTGRLEEAERGLVDEHLATCAACQAELGTERAWQLISRGEGAPADVESGWSAMRARLGAGPVGDEAGASPARRRALPRWFVGAPARAWVAPGLLSVALLAAIGVTLQPTPRELGDYHALAAAPTGGATAVVRFRPDATEAQIRHGLQESGARLVDGPTVTDAYVVRLPRDRYTAALDKLRRQPGVALVEALEAATPP